MIYATRDGRKASTRALDAGTRGWGYVADELPELAQRIDTPNSTRSEATMNGFRTFSDSTGVRWTVLRIEPDPVSPTLERLRETMSRGRPERRRPWLLFESKMGERRRLAPVPDEWDQPGSDQLLSVWCAMAEQVPPAPERRAADLRYPSD